LVGSALVKSGEPAYWADPPVLVENMEGHPSKGGSPQKTINIFMAIDLSLKAPFFVNANYHVAFKSIDGFNLFQSEKDYDVFKKRYLEFLTPYFISLAYSLMDNHVHLIVKINTTEAIEKFILNLQTEKRTVAMKKFLENKTDELIFDEMLERQCNSFMVSYANYIGNKYKRKGGLFQKPFKRIRIADDTHLQNAIIYANANAEHHKLVDDFKKHQHNGYLEFLTDDDSFINSAALLSIFKSKEIFQTTHKIQVELYYKKGWPNSKLE
jgi:putative transposase